MSSFTVSGEANQHVSVYQAPHECDHFKVNHEIFQVHPKTRFLNNVSIHDKFYFTVSMMCFQSLVNLVFLVEHDYWCSTNGGCYPGGGSNRRPNASDQRTLASGQTGSFICLFISVAIFIFCRTYEPHSMSPKNCLVTFYPFVTSVLCVASFFKKILSNNIVCNKKSGSL